MYKVNKEQGHIVQQKKIYPFFGSYFTLNIIQKY